MIEKEALEHLDLQSLKAAEPIKYNNLNYAPVKYHAIQEPTAEPLKLQTLDGLIEYIERQNDTMNPVIIHVVNPDTIHVHSSANAGKSRDFWVRVDAVLPQFSYGEYLSAENMIIKLRSGFKATEARDSLIQFISSIKEEKVRESLDDGISQAVVAKNGVASVSTVTAPPTVILQPFRTFIEVEQPASEFIFRLRSGDLENKKPTAMILEADGGAWRVAAVKNVGEYLRTRLADKITANFVTLLA